MSELIQVFSTASKKTNGYFGTTDINNLGESGSYSSVIGLDKLNGKNFWRILRYELDFIKETDSQPITGAEINKLYFSRQGAGYFSKQSGVSSQETDYDIYGYFSNEADLPPAKLIGEKDSFKIVNFKDLQAATTVTVDLADPKIITFDQQNDSYKRYLYLFTKNGLKGDSDARAALCYWSSGSTNGQYSTVTGEGQFITYSQLSDPIPGTAFSGIIPPNKQIELAWSWSSENDTDYLNGFLINWTCGEQSGIIEIGENDYYEYEKGDFKYNYQAQELPRGQELQVYIATKHSQGDIYNSKFVKFEGQYTINSLPEITKIEFESDVIIPSQSAKSKLKPTITSTDINDGQVLTYHWRVGGNGGFLQYDEDIGLTLQNDKSIEVYAYDGLESGPIWSKIVGRDTIDGLSINSPPKLDIDSTQIAYDLSSDKLTIGGDHSDTLQVRASNKNQVTEWETYDSDTTIHSILNSSGFSGPFVNLTIECRLKDEYGDVSETKSKTIEPFIEKTKEEFLGQIDFEDLNSWNISIKEGFSGVQINGGTGKIVFTNPNELQPGTSYSFDIIASWGDFPVWRFNGIQATTQDFVKFRAAPEFIGAVKPFEAWLTDPMDPKPTFSCSVNASGPLEGRGVSLVLKDGQENLLIQSGTNDSTLSGYCYQKNMFQWGEGELGLTKLKGQHYIDAYLYYKIDDIEIKSPTAQILFDFDYVADSPTPQFIDPVYEQYAPTIDLSNFPIATQDVLELVLQVNRNDGKGFVNYGTYRITNPTGAPSVSDEGQLVLPTVTLTAVFESINEIADLRNRNWQVITRLVNNKSCKKISRSQETSVIQHGAPTNFIITGSTWYPSVQNQNNQIPGYALLDFKVNLNSNSDATEIHYSLASESGELSQTDSGHLSYTPDENASSPYSIQIEITTTTEPVAGIINTKSALSNIFIIYEDGPTVAYRPHYLGINTTTFESDALLQIVPFESHDKIYIKMPNAKNIVINLNTGEVSGLTINGGDWQ